eukprot:3978491-Pleurochrysis_carterae.AAC.1
MKHEIDYTSEPSVRCAGFVALQEKLSQPGVCFRFTAGKRGRLTGPAMQNLSSCLAMLTIFASGHAVTARTAATTFRVSQ